MASASTPSAGASPRVSRSVGDGNRREESALHQREVDNHSAVYETPISVLATDALCRGTSHLFGFLRRQSTRSHAGDPQDDRNKLARILNWRGGQNTIL
jgi:hypothetical protein